MTNGSAQNRLAPYAVPLDVLARRRTICLLVVLMLLGAVDLGDFVVVRFQPLLDQRAEHAATLAALEGEADSVAADALAQARLVVAESTQAVRRGVARIGGIVIGLLVLAWFLGYQRRRLRTPSQIVHGVTVLLLILGVTLLASALVFKKAMPDHEVVAWGILDLLVMHVAVCMIMPWRPRDAAAPFVVLLLVWAVTFLVPNASDWEIIDRVVFVIVSPALFLPGQLFAGWRYRRRAEDEERMMLGRQVLSIGGELSRARIVHEAMFPDPFTGHVCFDYEYLPIHEIGGDYVHAHINPDDERVTITLLDVAGHGLAAALTVNRLFGELERILAENQEADPAEIMSLLNRYIYLTMARHNLYATGLCMMLDPNTGELCWVNAGHPPAFMRRTSGGIEDLPTTALILGAVDPDTFDPDPHTTTLAPGDVVIAYTDGVFEARNGDGKYFGMARVRETAGFDPPPRSWPRFIAGAVAQHHEGNADDDILIASITLRSRRITSSGTKAGQTTAVGTA